MAIQVVSVTDGSGLLANSLLWTFDAAVVVADDTLLTTLKAEDPANPGMYLDGDGHALGVSPSQGNQLLIQYSAAPNVGDHYSCTVSPTGITGGVTVPATGLIATAAAPRTTATDLYAHGDGADAAGFWYGAASGNYYINPISGDTLHLQGHAVTGAGDFIGNDSSKDLTILGSGSITLADTISTAYSFGNSLITNALLTINAGNSSVAGNLVLTNAILGLVLVNNYSGGFQTHLRTNASVQLDGGNAVIDPFGSVLTSGDHVGPYPVTGTVAGNNMHIGPYPILHFNP